MKTLITLILGMTVLVSCGKDKPSAQGNASKNSSVQKASDEEYYNSDCIPCLGKGKVRCDYCRAKGDIECPKCAKYSLQTHCGTCLGKKRVACPQCQYVGHTTCGVCAGRGKVHYEYAK